MMKKKSVKKAAKKKLVKKKAAKKKANKVGRPSKYDVKHCDQVYKLCLLGATDEEIASFFEVHIDTYYEWKKIYPKFSDAIKDGKIKADAEVAEKLFHRAKGYSHPEDKIFQYEGEPLVVPTTKHYPPDTAAAFIWLKNRRRIAVKQEPLIWRDKHEHELTGPDGMPLETQSDAVEIARKVAFLLNQGVKEEENGVPKRT